MNDSVGLGKKALRVSMATPKSARVWNTMYSGGHTNPSYNYYNYAANYANYASNYGNYANYNQQQTAYGNYNNYYSNYYNYGQGGTYDYYGNAGQTQVC